MSANSSLLQEYVKNTRKQVDGWLAYQDAEICRTILRHQHETLRIAGSCAEIGVHHGKLFIILCLALAGDEKAYCVDVFSDQQFNIDGSGRGDREKLEANLARFHVAPDRRVIVQSSSMDVRPEDVRAAVGPVRFFSVDGGHWLEIVCNDLRIAEASLCEGGVIALDDFHRPEWPEVSAGYFEWFATRTKALKPFAIGFNKLYLCESSYFETYRNALTSNPNLKPFLVKNLMFQSAAIPTYSECLLPETGLKKRVLTYLKLFHPQTYSFVRGLA